VAPDAIEQRPVRNGVPTTAPLARTTAAGITLRQELARKALHLASAALPIAWGIGLVSADALLTALMLAVAVAVLIEGARHLSPAAARTFDALVGPMVRPHERAGITGATWLAVAMFLSLVVFPGPAALIALWAAAVGDGSASVVGRLVADRRGGASTGKTLAGSLACAGMTAVGVLWFSELGLARALAIGVITALAERPRGPFDDNLRVAAAAGLAAWALGGA
jgi:phytol kinase